MLWRKFNGDLIEIPIAREVENAIRRETKNGYHLKVCIGTDSQVKGAETEFATVIVMLALGIFFFSTLASLLAELRAPSSACSTHFAYVCKSVVAERQPPAFVTKVRGAFRLKRIDAKL